MGCFCASRQLLSFKQQQLEKKQEEALEKNVLSLPTGCWFKKVKKK